MSAMLGQWMEREICEQPYLLATHGSGYYNAAQAAIGQLRPEMVVLAARGSSDNAAVYGRYLIEVFSGIPGTLAAPSVLTRYGRKVAYQRSLGIGISQSGAAPDVSEVLGMLSAAGHQTVAITNTPGSRLTEAATHSINLEAGTENSVAATKTFSTSLLALYQIARVLGEGLADPEGNLPDEAWVGRAREAAQEAAGAVVRSSPVFTLGRGFSFAIAQEGALKLMECALIPAKSYSAADFEHGPKALAGHGSAAISFDGPMPDLSAQGCEIIVAPAPPEHVPEPLLPLWHVVFAQWLALLTARARGLDPDEPQHIQKITRTL
jgi:glutamine---fructose-6-phosphate transaminase (isomerizing)